MQHRIKSITVPQPCSEDWYNMLPDAQGNFCTHCQKTVTDFTGLSNAEIINVLSSSGKTCGRFNEAQLINLNNELVRPRSTLFLWRKFSLAVAFIGFVPLLKVQAKVVKPVIELNPVTSKPIDLIADTNVVYKTITGQVLNNDDEMPIPGASVRVGKINTLADVYGRFSVTVPYQPGIVLNFTFIGFDSKDVKIDSKNMTSFTVVLNSSSKLMGEVYIASPKPSLFYRTWHGIKRLFS